MSDNIRIVDVDELRADVHRFTEETEAKLFSTGHEALDQFYKVYMGSCTDITGYPYSGKTLVLTEILVNTALNEGFKHIIYLPDSGNPTEICAQIIHKLTGKTFTKGFNNTIDKKSIDRGFDKFVEHFRIVDKRKEKGAKRITPYELWDFAAASDYDTCTIDSWNYMNHRSDLSKTDYLADVLAYRNEVAQGSGKHFFNIIHPRNPVTTDYDKDGVLKPPTVHNIMNGSEWNNNGKSIIVVHKEQKEGVNYDIYFRKTKPRAVGKTGNEVIQYDINKARFYKVQPKGGRKESKQWKVKAPQIQVDLSPNKDFDNEEPTINF